jgi:outer membrane protein with beta-barrel domain
MKQIGVGLSIIFLLFQNFVSAQETDTLNGIADTTVIEIGKTKIEVIEKDGKSEVTIETDNKQIIVSDDKIQTKKKKKNDKYLKNIKTRFLLFELGINGYLSNNSTNLPENLQDFELNYAQSWNVNIYLFKQRINLIAHRLNIMYGFGIEMNDYAFRHDVTLQDKSAYTETIPLDKSPKKSKLASNYLIIPLQLNFESNPYSRKRSFRISAGVYGGMLVWGRTKVNYKNLYIRTNDSFNLSQFRYGLTSSIGFSFFNIYFNYALSPLFNAGKGPELQPFAIGLVFLGF